MRIQYIEGMLKHHEIVLEFITAITKQIAIPPILIMRYMGHRKMSYIVKEILSLKGVLS